MRRGLWLRYACFGVAVVFGLTVAVPVNQVNSKGPNQFPLAGLMRFLATQAAWAWERPNTPQQQVGGPARVTDPVSTQATTANGGAGRAPGKAKGELGEYTPPKVDKAKTSTTGQARTGFDETTSQRVANGATKTSELYRNADGSYTRNVSTQPVNYRAADGSWQPIDTTLVREGDRIRVTASGVQVSLAANPRRAWGNGAAQDVPGELANVVLPTGEIFGYDLDGAAAVEPVLEGASARYPEMLPHTDVELAAFGGGLKETLVLNSRQAASSWIFPLRLKGLTAQLQKDGSVWLLDKAGNLAARIPKGYMQDAKFLENEGDFVKSDGLSYELVKLPGGDQALKVTAERAWLDDPARVYPVRVDPTTTVSTDGDVNIDPNPNTHAADQNGTSIAVGWDGDRVGSPLRNDVKISFISFGDFNAATPEHPSLAGMRIQWAWLNLYHTWTPSGACSTYRPIYVHTVLGPWTVAGLEDAASGPNISSAIGEMLITNNTPACSNTGGNRSIGRWVSTSIQDLRTFDGWSHGVLPNYGLALTASGSENAAFKRFTSENYTGTCAGRNCQPYLGITYAPDTKPQMNELFPANGFASPTLTPELLATASDAEGDPLSYEFSIFDTNGTRLGGTNGATPARSWTVPAGLMQWGQSYIWAAQATDGLVWTEAKYSVISPAPPQPLISSTLSQNGGQGFEPRNGNYTTHVTDVNIPNAGPPLAVERFYNSRDPRKGAFGLGWSSVLDSNLTYGLSDNGAYQWVKVRYPDGQEVVFGRNADGSYAPPPGRHAILKRIDDLNWELTDKAGVRYRFGAAGMPSPVISSIEDAHGREISFVYASGKLTTMQARFKQYDFDGTLYNTRNGRKLTFAWTGATLTSVTTERADTLDPNSVSTWTYSYAGDLLTTVCPPTSTPECTRYEYGTDGLSQPAVMAQNPHTYLRLSEAGGTAAASTATDPDTATGTYHDVELGRPGSPGTQTTAAGFNGASSWVQLPNKAAFRSTQQTISMWFRTGPGFSGPLFSAATEPLPTIAPSGWNPVLYIDSDGKLRGQKLNGQVAPITSTVAVTDEQWHHVALTVASNTQTLYLDGQAVGTLSGNIELAGEDNFYIGAGQWKNWPGSSGDLGYFTGTIAEFSFYTRALTAAQVKSVRDAGASSRNWLYPSAVLDADPHSYLRLDDVGGPAAIGEPTDSAEQITGVYTNVTLGQPGPPGSLTTSAGFNGTSSSAELSDKAALRSAYQSVSMWFKAAPGTSGVLLSAQSGPLPTQPGGWNPVLYLGTDGKLRAEKWAGSVNPITAAPVVNDGNWHHAVLSVAGNTQALYLDGTFAGSLNAVVSFFGENRYYLGAGNWSNWPAAGGAPNGYLNGSIADFAFYTKPLSADQAKTLRDAGAGASQPLVKIVKPLGGTQAEIAYDSAGVVSSVVDDNGAKWTISPATVSGSDGVYAASVLGGAPENYWRLGDTGTPTTAYNELNGGTAAFNQVTLGEAGPFSLSIPRTAAKFNGTSSYMRLPGTDSPHGGLNAVSLWFKLAAGSTQGGILYSYQQTDLTSPTTGYHVPIYVGTDGKLRGEFWSPSGCGMSASRLVNDGNWHHFVLSDAANTQALYLDGERVGGCARAKDTTVDTPYVYIGAGFWDGWAATGTNRVGYWPGWIAEVATYKRGLTAGDAAAQYAAYNKSAGAPARTVTVTDAYQNVTTYRYDSTNGRRLIEKVDALGGKTIYGYDTGGFLRSVTDPNGNMEISGHDVRGNVLSQTSCQDRSANRCSTAYFTYWPDATTRYPAPDPRNDTMLSMRDARSSSELDDTYLTTFRYDDQGNRTDIIDPAGRHIRIYYTSGISSIPDGLPELVFDAAGAQTTADYNSSGDLISTWDAAGLRTQYTRNKHGRVVTVRVTGEQTLTTRFRYDKLGRVVEKTDPATRDEVTGAIHTKVTTTRYDGDGRTYEISDQDTTGGDAPRVTAMTFDPVTGKLASAATQGNLVRFEYDKLGRVSKQIAANGVATAYGYDALGNPTTKTLAGYTGDPNNPQPAQDKVLESRQYDPAGRLAAVTDADGYRTEFTYTDNGLLASAVKRDPPPGAEATFGLEYNTYDAAGHLVKRTTNDGKSTLDMTIDVLGRTTETILDKYDPSRSTSLERKTTYAYSLTDQVTRATTTQPSKSYQGGGTQTVDTIYDIVGRKVQESVNTSGSSPTAPIGWWKMDNFTGGTVLDSALPARSASTEQGLTGWPGDGSWEAGPAWMGTDDQVLNTTQSFTVSVWARVNDTATAGTIVSQDGFWRSGFEVAYTGGNGWSFAKAATDGNGAVTSVSGSAPSSAGEWVHVVAVYDNAAGQGRLYLNGVLAQALPMGPGFSATGQFAIGRGKFDANSIYTYKGRIDNVQAYQRAVSAAEASKLYSEGRGGRSLNTDVTNSWEYDRRGLMTAAVDPNGARTTYRYDEAGRRTASLEPTVTAEEFGASPVQAIPISSVGYDTFGDVVESKDPKGRVVTYVRDGSGQVVETRMPVQAGMTPVYGAQYDQAGNLTAATDPRGKTTTYVYDQLNRLAKVTNPMLETATFTYDMRGNMLSQTDGEGARAEATYDFLGRLLTKTDVVRQPAPAAYTTNYGYENAWLARVTSPGGLVDAFTHNVAGEMTSHRDPAGNTTKYWNDYAGRPQYVRPAAGAVDAMVYDAAGRMITHKLYNQPPGSDPNAIVGSEIDSRSFGYDNSGNLLSSTDFNGNTTTYAYDAGGRLTTQTEPEAITSTFGYDLAGAPTRFTNGRNNQFWTTYNNWGLAEQQIEPATTAFPALADRTFSTGYDIAGRPVTQSAPGGVTATYTFDDADRVTAVAGAGAEAATANRNFTYYRNGRVKTLSGNGGDNTLTYDDRGLLLSSIGPSGNSSFSYDSDGQLASRVDAAGTTTYGYTSGRLATITNPAASVNATLTYNSLSQVTGISYGATADRRTLGYDTRNRLISDELTTNGGATVAKILYGWDDNSNLTSKTTTGFAGAASNAYKYDRANRLTEWNNGATVTAYEYDKAGNRTRAGAKTFTYNERDQLQSESVSGTTYQYTARGTLARTTTGTVSLDTQSDAFGQVIRQYHAVGSYSDYAYDGLGRALKAGFQYTGTENDLASDGTATYVRDPAGAPVGLQSGGNQRLVWTDAHQDVVAQFGAASTTLAGSTTYDPLGKVVASGGMSGNLGYQSEWTDQQTGRVNMHARWYNPESGQFDARDSMALSASPESVNANRYTYANQNPLTGTDPSGHMRTREVADGGFHSDEYIADYKRKLYNGGRQLTGDPAIDCGDSNVTCFFEGLFSIISISDLFSALGSLMKGIKMLFSGDMDEAYALVEQGFKELEKEANEWRDKVTKAFKMSGTLARVVGWACVLSGLCAPLNDCFGDGKGKCAYHIGEVTAQAVLSVFSGGGAKVYERLKSLINKALRPGDRDHDSGNDHGDGHHDPNGSGGHSTPTPDASDSRFARHEDDQDRATEPKEPTGDKPSGGRNNNNKDNSSPGDNDGDDLPGVTVCGSKHSFDPSTPVLMADHTIKPISEIGVGQKVLATDPVTGQTSAQEVTLLHLNLDEKLTDITLGEGEGDRSTRGPTTTLHTTQNHPLWDATSKSWVEAKDLVPGASTLTGPDGQLQAVTRVRNYTGRTEMRDLTVANIHTYYVIVAGKPTLVHNNDPGLISLGGSGEACGIAADDTGARGRLAAIVDEITKTIPKDLRPGTVSETIGRRPSGLLVVAQSRSMDTRRYPFPHQLRAALAMCHHPREGGCSEVSGIAGVMQFGAWPVSVTTMGVHSHGISKKYHKAIMAPCGGCTLLLKALDMTSAGRLD